MPTLEGRTVKGFHERFAEALRVRLYPNSTLRLKRLAAGINRSEHTISRWWHGESRPLAEDIDRMAAFFSRRGDRDFLRALFGEAAAPAEHITDETLTAFLRKLLDKASLTRETLPEHNLWFSTDGAMAPAPLGHAKFVGEALSMPLSGDLVRYAVSILGWIAVTVQPDDVVTIRHDGRRVARLAAERVCEWLRSGAGNPALVRRAINLDGRWVDADHDTAELAASAVEKIACIVRAPRRRWNVTRLPLDAINHPRLQKLLDIHRDAPDKIIHAAADMGAFTVSGVFSVDGENVVSHHVPTEFRDLEPRLIEGRNVLSRADTDYALMVWARILQAKRERLTFHELSGSVNNFNVHYLSLAMAEPGDHGRVLTSTVVLGAERIAA
jgi:transcriptional regulator with XRE-family HTH domain